MSDQDDLRARNIAVAEHVIRTCGELRPHEVHELFTEDAVLALPYAPAGTPTEVVGRDAVIDYISLLADHIPAGVFTGHTFDTLAGNPDEVIARYTAATELLSTGSPYENTYVTLIELRDGKVARYTEYFNPINWLVAQGGTVAAPA